MAELEIKLEDRDAEKLWEAKVTGTKQTIRFGKIGSPGHTKLKTFASEKEAIAATEKAASDKRKDGFADVGAKPAPAKTNAAPSALQGGLFVKANDNVTANAIAAKLRGEGKLSKTDPKKPEGFGADGLVGVAVHPATDGYFPVVDSADGAQGIGGGGWSAAALMSNHLGTDVIWYRVYSNDRALGVRFHGGSQDFTTQAGDAKFIKTWVENQGAPLKAAVRPKAAGKKAVLYTVKYQSDKYRSGPDEAGAEALGELAQMLSRGEGKNLASKYASLDEKTAELALGIIRSETRGKAEQCISGAARAIFAGKVEYRKAPKVPTLAEVVLRRAIQLESKDDVAEKLFARLDAIETDAEKKSDWAQTTGVWNAAAALTNSSRHARAHIGWAALVRRKDPHWLHVNMAVSSMLNGSKGKITLTGETKKTIDACETRMKALGKDAQDAILYNLACVYARAGDEAKALDRLDRCTTIKQQNPNPEKDTDLASLWKNPKFQAIIGGKAANSKLAAPVDESDEDDEDDDDYEVPKARAIPRMNIKLVKGGDAKALTNRIGGLPCAPKGTEWPESASRPMQLVAQLVGKAAGGEIDLGDVHVVQIFADMAGDYYEENKVIVHQKPCKTVLEAPAGCEPIAVRTMKLTPGADDDILVLVDDPDDEDALAKHGADADQHEEAYSHAFADKLFGLPAGANLPDVVKDSKKKPMRLLMELTSYDDWFLWALFTNADFSEMKLEVVRG